MALKAATIASLKRLHGEPFLKRVTNPEASGASVDEDVLNTAIDTAIRWFARLGYDFDETSPELQYYSVLFMQPRTLWSEEMKELAAERDDIYVHQFVSPSSTSIAAGGTDDRRHFSDKQLDALDKIRRGAQKPGARGNL